MRATNAGRPDDSQRSNASPIVADMPCRRSARARSTAVRPPSSCRRARAKHRLDVEMNAVLGQPLHHLADAIDAHAARLGEKRAERARRPDR